MQTAAEGGQLPMTWCDENYTLGLKSHAWLKSSPCFPGGATLASPLISAPQSPLSKMQTILTPTPQVAVRIKVNFVKYCLAHSRCSQCHMITSVGPRHFCFSFEMTLSCPLTAS